MSSTEPVICFCRLSRWQPLRRKEGASQRVQLSVGKACMGASSMRAASIECRGSQQLKLVAESTPVLPQWPSFHKLMRCGRACCFPLSDTMLAHQKRKDKFMLFSDHIESLLRRQPGALPIGHDAVGCYCLLLFGLGFHARCSTALLYVDR